MRLLLAALVAIAPALLLNPAQAEARKPRPVVVAAPQLDAETAALLDAALAGAHRSDADKARDAARHPRETLAFFGLRKDMTVIEVAPGGGWWTAVLAPVLKDQGRLVAAQNTDVNGAGRKGLAATLTRYADKPDIYGKVALTPYDPASDTPMGPDASADMVLLSRHLHGLVARDLVNPVLKLAYAVLKPGGVLAIEQHRWPEGKPYPERQPGWPVATNGYLTESAVIGMAKAAGFALAGRSEINANPRDTRDYPSGVWALPPTLIGGETDRERMVAIGESDRMTLKFVKPAS